MTKEAGSVLIHTMSALPGAQREFSHYCCGCSHYQGSFGFIWWAESPPIPFTFISDLLFFPIQHNLHLIHANTAKCFFCFLCFSNTVLGGLFFSPFPGCSLFSHPLDSSLGHLPPPRRVPGLHPLTISAQSWAEALRKHVQ